MQLATSRLTQSYTTPQCGSGNPTKSPRFGLRLTPGEVGAVGRITQKHVIPTAQGFGLGAVTGLMSGYALLPAQLGTILAFISLVSMSFVGTVNKWNFKPVTKLLASPLTYFDWRAAKHYIRTGQQLPLFFPNTQVQQFRQVTHHAPMAGAAVGSVAGLKLGAGWAERGASEGEKLLRHTTTTLAGGTTGYGIGYGIKRALLEHLKHLKFLK
ncbi:MAG: hypothetical protein ACKO37_06750 [Vampirovibrionales bacterium]